MRNNFLRFYIFLVNSVVGIYFSISTLYLLDKGISAQWIAYLISFEAFITLISEMPTGIFADMFGQKLSLLLSFIISTFSIYVLIVSYSTTQLVIAFLLGGLSSALFSGSSTAWMVETFTKSKDEYSDFFRIVNIWNLLSKIIGALIGGYLFFVEMNLPFYLILFLRVITILAFLAYSKGKIVQKGRRTLREINTSIINVFQNKSLFRIFLITAFFVLGINAIFMYWQPLFFNKLHDKNPYLMGYIYVLTTLFSTFGSFLLKKLKFMSEDVLFVFSLLTGGSFLILTAFITNFIFSLLFFCGYHFSLGISGPLRMMLINKEINRNRASVLSMLSVFESLATIFGAILWGSVYTMVGYNLTIVFSGAFVLASVIPFLVFEKNRGVPNHK